MDIYKEPESKGWEYPWAINKVCSTVKKGEFIAMVGNAGSGKTWYALYMSMFWAMRYGLKVFILSKEMNTDSIRGRLACMVAQVPFNRYMSKALTQRDDYRLRIASKAVIERGVQIDLCHTSITEASGMSKIRQR